MEGSAASLIVRAADFAARAHADQHRKGPRAVPYVNHVTAVAALVAEASDDAAILAAALLHDTLEDSAATLADLEAEFGGRVAAIVGELTDDPEIGTPPVFQRKARQAAKIAGASPAAKLVKIADQTCNLADLVASPPGWPPDRMRAYLDGARMVVDACRDTDPGLEARFDAAAERLSSELG